MSKNCTLYSQSINIDSYLNLGQNLRANLLESIDQANQFEIESNNYIGESQILLQKCQSNWLPGSSTIPSQVGSNNVKKSAKQATAKYREKRKKYQQQLEQNVKNLQDQISNIQTQIKKVKDNVLVKLQDSLKSVNNTENSEIFNQLENFIRDNTEDQCLIDIDKVNLLLNTLKYRIGPSGRQRQAKIEYNFKNIINTLFPGLIRYFIITAAKSQDIFESNNCKVEGHGWTKQLFSKMNLSEQQIQTIKNQQCKLKTTYQYIMDKVYKLRDTKKKMKQQAMLIDNVQNQIRESISPLQCAKWTLFCEKYKYQKIISLDHKFKSKNQRFNDIQEQFQQLLHCRMGRKKVHVDSQISKTLNNKKKNNAKLKL